jgi:catechol 2,3-dioxygenase-like lactoylglutathione lyase family enzyme
MKLTPAVIEIVVADMAASLAFYRRIGLDIPVDADAEPHVDVDLGGIHLAFDTRETILSFHTAAGTRWHSRSPATRPPRSTPPTPS